VSVDAGACSLQPLVGLDGSDDAILYIPTNVNISFDGGDYGSAVGFNLDQVNSLVSNGTAHDISLSNDSTFSASVSTTDYSTGDTAGISSSVSGNAQNGESTGSVSADASASVDAFTQSIVLGANVQTNTFSLTVVGHDAITADHGGVADTIRGNGSGGISHT
jgi:hypothetical protein